MMENAKSWVVITRQDNEYKNLYYSGPQIDDGTIAKEHQKELNKRNVGLFKLFIWDLTPYGCSIHNAPLEIKNQIKKISKEYSR